MARNKIPKKVITSVKSYRTKLEKSGVFVDQMLVFGSYAKGLWRDSSDIDVAVVSKSFGKDEMKDYRMLGLATWDVNTKIEAHPISLKDWKTGASPLILEIQKYGVAV